MSVDSHEKQLPRPRIVHLLQVCHPHRDHFTSPDPHLSIYAVADCRPLDGPTHLVAPRQSTFVLAGLMSVLALNSPCSAAPLERSTSLLLPFCYSTTLDVDAAPVSVSRRPQCESVRVAMGVFLRGRTLCRQNPKTVSELQIEARTARMRTMRKEHFVDKLEMR